MFIKYSNEFWLCSTNVKCVDLSEGDYCLYTDPLFS